MGFAANLAVDKLSERLAGTTERAIATVVERRGPAVVRAAERLRAEFPGRSPAELAQIAVSRSGRRVAGTGAVSALPATLPGAGTMVEVGAALGDASLLTVAQTELVLLLAHLHGRPIEDVEARRLDVLMAMGVEAGVVDLRRDGTVRVMGTPHRDGELSGEAGRQARQADLAPVGGAGGRQARQAPGVRVTRPGVARGRSRPGRRVQLLVDAQAGQRRARLLRPRLVNAGEPWGAIPR
jgi:hypothetical protein